jgi:hypothetical protein
MKAKHHTFLTPEPDESEYKFNSAGHISNEMKKTQNSFDKILNMPQKCVRPNCGKQV